MQSDAGMKTAWWRRAWCFVIGHRWPVYHVTDVARPVGECQRCGSVATRREAAATCRQCGAWIVREDHWERRCLLCGGRNRKAVVLGP